MPQQKSKKHQSQQKLESNRGSNTASICKSNIDNDGQLPQPLWATMGEDHHRHHHKPSDLEGEQLAMTKLVPVPICQELAKLHRRRPCPTLLANRGPRSSPTFSHFRSVLIMLEWVFSLLLCEPMPLHFLWSGPEDVGGVNPFVCYRKVVVNDSKKIILSQNKIRMIECDNDMDSIGWIVGLLALIDWIAKRCNWFLWFFMLKKF